MTTRVATLSAGADGEGDVAPEAGGKVGRGMNGLGDTATMGGESLGPGAASTGAL